MVPGGRALGVEVRRHRYNDDRAGMTTPIPGMLSGSDGFVKDDDVYGDLPSRARDDVRPVEPTPPAHTARRPDSPVALPAG